MSLLLALAQAAALATAPAPAEAGTTDYQRAYFEAAHPASARDMLDRIPGFTFDGGSSVRGFEDAAGNVLVNGQRPVAKTDSLDAILRRIPTSSVDHIEIIHGGASGVDMQGRSVLANIVLRKEAPASLQASMSLLALPDKGLSAPQVRLVASGRQGDRKWDFSLLGGSYIDSTYGDGPTRITDAKGQTLQTGLSQSTAMGRNYQATGGYELSVGGGQLRLNGLLQRSPYDDDITRRTLTPKSALEREHVSNDADSSEFGARFTRDLGPTMALELVALSRGKDTRFGDVVRSPSSTIDFAQNSRTGEDIVRGVVRQKTGKAMTWEVGAEGALNTLHNRLAYSENGQSITLPSANVTVTERRYEAFAKARWTINRQWTLETDLRQELSQIASKGDTVLSKSLSYTKPRLALKWAYAKGNEVRLRVEREVGQLNFTDFTASSALKNGVVTAGNPDLDPEAGWASELVLEHRILKDGAVVLTGKHVEMSDVIDRAPILTPTGAIDSPANIGSGTRDELVLNATLPLASLGARGLQVQANGTWRRSRVTDPTTHRTRSISGLPDQEWDVRLNWDIPARNLSLSLSVAEEMAFTNYRFNRIETLKIQPTVKLIATWTPSPRTLVQAGIFNLNRQRIGTLNDVHGGPRSTVGLAYRDQRQESLGPLFSMSVRRSF